MRMPKRSLGDRLARMFGEMVVLMQTSCALVELGKVERRAIHSEHVEARQPVGASHAPTTKLVEVHRVVGPQHREFDAFAAQLYNSVLVCGHRYRYLGLPWLPSLAGLNPMHAVPGRKDTHGGVAGWLTDNTDSSIRSLRWEALLPNTGRCGPLRHPGHP